MVGNLGNFGMLQKSLILHANGGGIGTGGACAYKPWFLADGGCGGSLCERLEMVDDDNEDEEFDDVMALQLLLVANNPCLLSIAMWFWL